jgi:hypothetical protein
MADTILTHDMLADAYLFDFTNNLGFTRNVYTGYNKEFHAVGRFQKGSSVRIHLPNQSRTIAGPDITGSIPDILENETTVTLDEHEVTPLDFTAQQLTLNIEDFTRKYIKNRTIAHANIVDKKGCQEYVNIYNQVGTPGVDPTTFSFLTDAATRLDQSSVPQDQRCAVMSPKGSWGMADGELKSVFVQPDVRRLTKKGFAGSAYAMFDMYMDQNIQSHTTGTDAANTGITVKTQPAEGATSIALQGLTASTGTIVAGDVFTIATVAGVNPVSGDVWEGSELRQFTATATATADASGDATVSVSPAIISSAASTTLLPYQTVNDLPAVSDAVTISGAASTAYPQHLLFHPECFAMTMVPFARPDSAGQSVKWATATDEQLGLSITYSSSFNILTFVEVYRLDTLFGWDTIRPALGVRGTG